MKILSGKGQTRNLISDVSPLAWGPGRPIWRRKRQQLFSPGEVLKHVMPIV
jgi:hypothetical protein